MALLINYNDTTWNLTAFLLFSIKEDDFKLAMKKTEFQLDEWNGMKSFVASAIPEQIANNNYNTEDALLEQ